MREDSRVKGERGAESHTHVLCHDASFHCLLSEDTNSAPMRRRRVSPDGGATGSEITFE